jgi:predicted O-methyltransferase YrrM
METFGPPRHPSSPPPQALRRLRADTAAAHPGRERNMVSVEQGAFLGWLVGVVGAARAVEVGVFTGYSATCIAAALPAHGTLVALEKDEAPLVLARQAWADAGVAARVDVRVGDAAASLAALLADPGAPGSYDFAFIDADKRGYGGYFEQCLALVRPGGVIAVDNLLWYGRVADPADASKATLAVREVNDMLVKDERIDFSLVPVGDGIGLCRKR